MNRESPLTASDSSPSVVIWRMYLYSYVGVHACVKVWQPRAEVGVFLCCSPLELMACQLQLVYLASQLVKGFCLPSAMLDYRHSCHACTASTLLDEPVLQLPCSSLTPVQSLASEISSLPWRYRGRSHCVARMALNS